MTRADRCCVRREEVSKMRKECFASQVLCAGAQQTEHRNERKKYKKRYKQSDAGLQPKYKSRGYKAVPITTVASGNPSSKAEGNKQYVKQARPCPNRHIE